MSLWGGVGSTVPTRGKPGNVQATWAGVTAQPHAATLPITLAVQPASSCSLHASNWARQGLRIRYMQVVTLPRLLA